MRVISFLTTTCPTGGGGGAVPPSKQQQKLLEEEDEKLLKCTTSSHDTNNDETKKTSIGTVDYFETISTVSCPVESSSFRLFTRSSTRSRSTSSSISFYHFLFFTMILWSSCCSCSSWSSNITTIVGVSATATHVLPSIKEEEERRPFNHFKTGAVRIRRSSSTTTTSRVATTSSNSNGNSTSSSSSSSVTCPVVDTVADFDIEQYAARPWYSHQQAVNFYLPQRLNYCVRADYNVRDRPTFPWGYTVDVRNQAQDKDGKLQGGNLCAYQTDLESGQQPGKLAVAPCFLPKMFAGPYWVLLYNEEKGYALISGGQPSTPSYDDKDGNFIGCRTGKGINDAGLWIFSRSPVRDQEMIDFVRGMAVEMGIDVTVLNDVNHEGCTYNDIDDDDDDDGAGAGAGNDENLAPTPVPSSYTSIVPTTEQDQEEEDNGDNEGDQQCMDSTEPFKLWFDIFGAEKDCDWVKEKSWWRCIFYSNLCPKTCGNCNGD